MTNPKQHEGQVAFILRALQVIGIVGMIYCAYLITTESTIMPQWRLLLYAAWFAIAAASAEAIIEWFKAGVVLLVLATVGVGAVEIAMGLASFGGMALAAVLMFVIIEYVLPEWWQYE